jgi:hypothetical protein
MSARSYPFPRVGGMLGSRVAWAAAMLRVGQVLLLTAGISTTVRSDSLTERL